MPLPGPVVKIVRLAHSICAIFRSLRWSVEALNETVERELDALPADMRARFVRISELIAAVGLDRLREPYVKHVQGPLWEMRLTGRAGVARALYVTVRDRRVVVVRVFVKKTRKTPAGEVRLALRRARKVFE